jgi:hypothetical protein
VCSNIGSVLENELFCGTTKAGEIIREGNMVTLLHRICRRPLLHFIVFAVLAAIAIGQRPTLAADDHPVPISTIVANPQASNRQAVVLKGTATGIQSVNGSDVFGGATCGQSFTLEDPTGYIEVWYVIRCSFAGTAVTVAERDELLITATIDALQGTDVKTSSAPKAGFRAMAKDIRKLKR